MYDCPVCRKEPANHHPTLGLLPGEKCRVRRLDNRLPDQVVELAGSSIKTQRNEYASSAVQPFSSDGTFSAEYYDAHGTKGVKVTPEQIKKRKKVWKGVISDNMDIKKTK